MKYTILIILIIILFLLFILPPLYEESKNKIANYSNSIFGNNSTSTYVKESGISSSVKKQAVTIPQTQAPRDFKGPTGKPHIIGPAGPPPNY